MFSPWVLAPVVAGCFAYATLTILPKPEKTALPLASAEPYIPGADQAKLKDQEPSTDAGPFTKLAQPVALRLAARGLPRAARRRDLRLLDRDVVTYLGQQIASGIALALIGVLFYMLLLAEGFPVPAMWLVTFAGLAALYGVTAPGRSLKAEADSFRGELRYATGNLLTLTSICLAAGGGIGEALSSAIEAGEGAAAQTLRDTVTYAQATGAAPWDALDELGRTADVPELVELAAAISLNGTEGTRLQAALSTKAVSLRDRLLTAREQAEQANCEKTALPIGVLMIGYLLLVGFPAATSVLQSI